MHTFEGMVNDVGELNHLTSRILAAAIKVHGVLGLMKQGIKRLLNPKPAPVYLGEREGAAVTNAPPCVEEQKKPRQQKPRRQKPR